MQRLILIALILGAAASPAAGGDPADMPWRDAGLSEREAAVHLLNRFAFGPAPGNVDTVVELGLDRWLVLQLAGALPDAELDRRLAEIDVLAMPSEELAETYPGPGMVLRRAREAGVFPEDMDPAELADGGRRSVRREIYRYALDQGYRPQRELMAALGDQKLLRAVYSSNQLTEVMTDFWFNHFNVSVSDPTTRSWILQYERDAIRPNALGTFRDLLGATARHPAMLLYLDNAMSVAGRDATTTMDWEAGAIIAGLPDRRTARFYQSRLDRHRAREGSRPGGATDLNENFARELLELHTLGVDGGYTQNDIVEAARALTGWTVLPPGPERERALQRLERADRVGGLGFVIEGDFLFRADAHDAGPKEVLGVAIAEGGGLDDGEILLDVLAAHPSTAHHIATKLAVRFVSDDPPSGLVDRLAAVFRSSGGDIPAVMAEIAASDEFWREAARPSKLKKPLEVAASSIRATGAGLADSRDLIDWIERMGEPLYRCAEPTGFPDTAEDWLNAGTLLNRVKFATELADDSIRGVDVNYYGPGGLAALDPEDLTRRLLPGRSAQALVVSSGDAEIDGSERHVVASVLSSPQFQWR